MEASNSIGHWTSGAGAEPGYFGTEGEELFGWLYRGDREDRRAVGVVLCGTLGNECFSSHRAIRVLAETLAGEGVSTLRFDYAYTGDSVDPPGETLQLSRLVRDVRKAVQVIRATCDVEHVFLVGVRLGTLFAAKAAELEEFSGLIMWGPVVSGRRFVREWNRLEKISRSRVGQRDMPEHERGSALGNALLDELTGASLLQINPMGKPACLVLERDELAPENELIDRLSELGLAPDRSRPGGFLAGMVNAPHLTELPLQAIQEISQWLADKSARLPEPTCRKDPARQEMSTTIVISTGPTNIKVRERFLSDGETGGLFGVISEPVERANWNGRYVLLLNSGTVHHIGPNRMYVTMARRMAREGFCVCRADLSGIGDSQVRDGSQENDSYPLGAVDDIARIVAALRRDGEASRIALVGLCSGAWASFHGGLVIDKITDLVLIDPDFYGERSVVGKPVSFIRPKDYSQYKHATRSRTKWRKLLTGRANYIRIIRVLWLQAGLIVSTWRRRMQGELHQLDRDLMYLAGSRLQVGFVFSPGDGGLDFLRLHGSTGRQLLDREGLLRETTINNADHTFSSRSARIELEETLLDWLS